MNLRIKNGYPLEKIETVFEPNEEDSAPVFAFNNVAFEKRCTGSQLECVRILNLAFSQETKIYVIFK